MSKEFLLRPLSLALCTRTPQVSITNFSYIVVDNCGSNFEAFQTSKQHSSIPWKSEFGAACTNRRKIMVKKGFSSCNDNLSYSSAWVNKAERGGLTDVSQGLLQGSGGKGILS